ncbi:MAG TPA: glycosyltransferase [Solirubrobacteraceae bacterium]|jgi:glycosyltransferase involved in cell wall biosynthesis
MTATELTDTSRPTVGRGGVCVLVVARNAAAVQACLDSVHAHTPAEVPIVIVAEQPSPEVSDLAGALAGARETWLVHADSAHTSSCAITAATDWALSQLWPADVVVLSEACTVGAAWLTRLRAAAGADTNTASASALADERTPLALFDARHPREAEDQTTSSAEGEEPLRPRLELIVGPCVYLRRDALELVGGLDRAFDLRWALEVDFAQRCLLSGLAHVAADDVIVRNLAGACAASAQMPQELRERYPYLAAHADAPGPDCAAPVAEREEVAASNALPRALETARRPGDRLSVTIDVRSLGTTMTGTHRHILELAKALAATGALRLRALVSRDTAAAALDVLDALPHTDILSVHEIDADTPRSTIFHRPQQVFETTDLRLAMRLGERLVLNQLDLIAYRNPGYHASAAAWHSHRRVNRQALASADRVVVFSEHTRLELISDELVGAERIALVAPGLDHDSRGEALEPRAHEAAARAALEGAPGTPGYLLCLGTDLRHKNRVFALRVLTCLRDDHGWDGRLVLAGAHIEPGSSRELEQAYLDRHPELRSAVVELGAVSEEQKAWLMSHTAAVIYPSVYEGFGLVPLEAGISGVPCVFAPQSSLAEVVPASAATIVPWDAAASAERAYALLSDAAARAAHVATLVSTARELTWARAASAMLGVYGEAAVAPTREAARLSRDEVHREHELRELTVAHDALVARIAEERDHAKRMYHEAWRAYTELRTEVGSGLSLIGPNGSLPDDLQRALLALSARPAVGRRLFGAGAVAFRGARTAARRLRRSKHETS